MCVCLCTCVSAYLCVVCMLNRFIVAMIVFCCKYNRTGADAEEAQSVADERCTVMIVCV